MDEIKLNLPPFYVGQKVVYIKNGRLPNGSIHIVRGIASCPHCKTVGIDVGLKLEAPIVYTCCGICGGDTTFNRIGKHNAAYVAASSFAPIEERFISLAEVIERESLVTSVN